MLLDLAVDVAKVLTPNKKLLTSPEGVAHPLPLLLIAWKLSGNDFKTKAFRKKWSSFCWEERATPHELLSNPLGAVWCREQDLDLVSASVNSMLDYLAGLEAANFSYSLINIHRSMLSSTLERSGAIPMGRLPFVKQLLKGVFNRNPPRPKYFSTWNVKEVVSLLASWGPNDQLNLMQLSKKLATLLALATFLM
jgi:hypothetical protein